MSPRPIASITVDLDTSHHYRAIHGLPDRGRAECDGTYAVGVRRLLDLFDELHIPATLFVIGQDIEMAPHRALLEEAHASGHELANHTFHHRYDLRTLSEEEIQRDLLLGEEAIARITGSAPLGFRTPGYNIDAWLFHLIEDRGYAYDSSVFPCPPYYIAKGMVMGYLATTGKPSRSAMTSPKTLLAPISPYKPMRGSLWRADTKPRRSGRPWQIPMALVPGVRFPLIGTSLHMIGAKGFDALRPLLRRAYPELFQLEFHAIDFMDSTDEGVDDLVEHQPDLRIPWEVKRQRYASIFASLARDYQFDTLLNGVRALDARAE